MQKIKQLNAVLITTLCLVVSTAQAKSPFTFSKALVFATKNSPQLQSARASVHASEGQLIQAKTYPNPSLDVSVENIAGSGEYRGVNSAETTVLVSQPIPLGGKRHTSQIVQQNRVRLSQKALLEAHTKLYRLLGQRYIEVLHAQSWLNTTSKLVRINRDIVKTIKRKIQAGAGSSLDLTTAEIQLSRSKIAETIAGQALLTDWKRLTILMGIPNMRYHLAADTGLPHRLKRYSQLAALLLHSPTWQKQVASSTVAYNRITLAHQQVWPDLTVGLGGRHFADTHDNSVVAEVSIPLPFFNRNEGNIASRLANYDGSLADQEQLLLTLKGQLRSLYQKAQSNRYRENTLRRTVLPDAKKAEAMAKAGYFNGRYPYVTLANAQATLLDTERDYWRAHMDFDESLVQIQGLLGQKID